MSNPDIEREIDAHFHKVCDSVEQELIKRRDEWTEALRTLLLYIPPGIETQLVTWDSGEKLFKIGIQVIER